MNLARTMVRRQPLCERKVSARLTSSVAGRIKIDMPFQGERSRALKKRSLATCPPSDGTYYDSQSARWITPHNPSHFKLSVDVSSRTGLEDSDTLLTPMHERHEILKDAAQFNHGQVRSAQNGLKLEPNFERHNVAPCSEVEHRKRFRQNLLYFPRSFAPQKINNK